MAIMSGAFGLVGYYFGMLTVSTIDTALAHRVKASLLSRAID